MTLFRCGGGGDVAPEIYALAHGENNGETIIGTITTESNFPKITFTVPSELVGRYIYIHIDQIGERTWVNPSADKSERFGSYSGIDINTEEIILNRAYNNGKKAFMAKYKVLNTTIVLKSANINPTTTILGFGLLSQINYPQGD